jgi:putative nicotinate phosphoribosyltransferase
MDYTTGVAMTSELAVTDQPLKPVAPATRSLAELSCGPLPSYESYLRFPDITYSDFQKLPVTVRRELVSRNKILNTDHYNLVMDRLTSQMPVQSSSARNDDLVATKTVSNQPASYTLQLRRSPFSYIVACGLEDAVERLTLLRITQVELDFAREYHAAKGTRLLNEDMWKTVIEKHDGRLPIEVYGVPDGTILRPGEPLARIDGPSELVAHFEHVFHRVFYESMVATKARKIIEILKDPKRFIEVGLRGAITDVQHMDALYAAFVGGGIDLTSSVGGACANNVRSGGTIGHRYLQVSKNEEEAFRFAIEHLDKVTLLIDLVDSMEGIKLALKLKQEYRDTGKSIGVRLDSGGVEGLKEQVRYFLRETSALGLTDPERDYIVVEGIDSHFEMDEIELMVLQEFGVEGHRRVQFGAGSLLISDGATRTAASSGLKQSSYTDPDCNLVPCMKPHRTGKGSYPGKPSLVIRDGRRMVAQEGETLSGDLEPLFMKLYGPDTDFMRRSSPEEAKARCTEMFQRVVGESGEIAQPILSVATIGMMREIFEKYGVDSSHLGA